MQTMSLPWEILFSMSKSVQSKCKPFIELGLAKLKWFHYIMNLIGFMVSPTTIQSINDSNFFSGWTTTTFLHKPDLPWFFVQKNFSSFSVTTQFSLLITYCKQCMFFFFFFLFAACGNGMWRNWQELFKKQDPLEFAFQIFWKRLIRHGSWLSTVCHTKQHWSPKVWSDFPSISWALSIQAIFQYIPEISITGVSVSSCQFK